MLGIPVFVVVICAFLVLYTDNIKINGDTKETTIC